MFGRERAKVQNSSSVSFKKPIGRNGGGFVVLELFQFVLSVVYIVNGPGARNQLFFRGLEQ